MTSFSRDLTTNRLLYSVETLKIASYRNVAVVPSYLTHAQTHSLGFKKQTKIAYFINRVSKENCFGGGVLNNRHFFEGERKQVDTNFRIFSFMHLSIITAALALYIHEESEKKLNYKFSSYQAFRQIFIFFKYFDKFSAFLLLIIIVQHWISITFHQYYLLDQRRQLGVL